MSFTAAEVGWLLGGGCNLRAQGEIHWQDVNSSYSARLALTAEGFTDYAAAFYYRIPKKRADEPSLVITFRGTHVYRLDINGSHRDGSKLFTHENHIQRRRSPDGPESYEPNPNGVPTIEQGKRVTTSQYRAILASFAAPIGLDILDVVWIDPPEGRQP